MGGAVAQDANSFRVAVPPHRAHHRGRGRGWAGDGPGSDLSGPRGGAYEWRDRRDAALGWLDDLATAKAERLLVYLDPPYFGKGRDLYTNFYAPKDHAAIAKRLGSFRRPWVLTYDDCPQIRKLYHGHRVLTSEVSYSAREVLRGSEVVVLAPQLKAPAPPTAPTNRGEAFRVV